MISKLRSQWKSFDAAYQYASIIHKNDVRKGGGPYMAHIDRIINNLAQNFDYDELLKLVIVAAVHDVFEDHEDEDISEFNQNIVASDCFGELDFSDRQEILEAIQAISKYINGQKTYENYSEYVTRIANNKLAGIVKIYDLMDNLSDLKDGNLKEKYQLTLHCLENAG